jgi:pimeloyl-ACP methyl ester carboxylesterase
MMKDPNYWKNYLLKIDAGVIERNLKRTTCKSRGLNLSLKYFEKDRNASNILLIGGTGGYSLFGVEMMYEMHMRNYNVFGIDFQGHGDSEGKRGDFTIGELVENCSDAAKYIFTNFNDRIGAIGPSIGGFITFYLGLAHGPVKSISCQNPAILTEKKFQGEVTKKAKGILPLAKLVATLFPKLKIPVTLYVDFKGFPETEREKEIFEKNEKDPDTVKWYTLRAAMSQILTPPPNPIGEMRIPTMFLVPTRDKLMSVSYVRDLYDRLPPIKKKFVEVNGGHWWMLSHSKEAAQVICDWFDETL